MKRKVSADCITVETDTIPPPTPPHLGVPVGVLVLDAVCVGVLVALRVAVLDRVGVLLPLGVRVGVFDPLAVLLAVMLGVPACVGDAVEAAVPDSEVDGVAVGDTVGAELIDTDGVAVAGAVEAADTDGSEVPVDAALVLPVCVDVAVRLPVLELVCVAVLLRVAAAELDAVLLAEPDGLAEVEDVRDAVAEGDTRRDVEADALGDSEPVGVPVAVDVTADVADRVEDPLRVVVRVPVAAAVTDTVTVALTVADDEGDDDTDAVLLTEEVGVLELDGVPGGVRDGVGLRVGVADGGNGTCATPRNWKFGPLGSRMAAPPLVYAPLAMSKACTDEDVMVAEEAYTVDRSPDTPTPTMEGTLV